MLIPSDFQAFYSRSKVREKRKEKKNIVTPLQESKNNNLKLLLENCFEIAASSGRCQKKKDGGTNFLCRMDGSTSTHDPEGA